MVGLLLLLGAGVTVWQRSVRPSAPARVVPAEKAPTVAMPNTPAIVVLPFVNLSRYPEQEYSSDGITEDLTFADLADSAVALDDVCQVRVAHPLRLSSSDLKAWTALFADYEIIQPFQQLARAVYACDLRNS